jgi:HK97 family phage portal protein
MGILDKFLENRINKLTPGIADAAAKQVISHVDQSLTKATPAPGSMPLGLKRYEFSPNMVNGNKQSRKKPGAAITFETMRRFSVAHEITRACINYRKRQISGLEWTIASADGDDKTLDKPETEVVKAFFKQLGGRGNGYRRFIDKFIEDLMVLDAVALERQRNRGGGLNTLIPVDGATIRIMVDESGALPEPPMPAYAQVIRGQVVAELTDDEMIYTYMNPRNDSPYGLSPIESLMVIISSSLKAGMYNLAVLTDGNMPEGFWTMPESWQPGQIKEFQEYWDALMAGDETMMRRLKFMPQGTFTASNKAEDMAWNEFNDWLMKVTCSLFEVDPKEIGFSPKSGLGGKGFSEQAAATTDRKGLAPLANLIEEIFTDVIQTELGYGDLKFQFTGLVEKDEKTVAETNEVLIRSGQRTVNELRTDDGLKPIDGLDKPFFAGQVTFLDEESQQSKADNAAAAADAASTVTALPAQDPAEDPKDDPKPPAEKRYVELAQELRTFRKYALNRFKEGKPLRRFKSEILPETVVVELNTRLKMAKAADEIRAIFKEYNDDFQVEFLAQAEDFRDALLKVV